MTERRRAKRTGVNSLVLLDVRELFEGPVTVVARILADVAVHERVLRQLLRCRERLEAQHALVALLVRTMSLLGVALHIRLVLKLLLARNSLIHIGQLSLPSLGVGKRGPASDVMAKAGMAYSWINA